VFKYRDTLIPFGAQLHRLCFFPLNSPWNSFRDGVQKKQWLLHFSGKQFIISQCQHPDLNHDTSCQSKEQGECNKKFLHSSLTKLADVRTGKAHPLQLQRKQKITRCTRLHK